MRRIYRILVSSLFLLLLLIPGQLGQAQSEQAQVRITQVDTSHFPKVTVYISATDSNGQPVGVNPNQIQILENGQVMQAEAVSGSGEIGPLTVLLVMDVSGSMNNGGKLDGAKSAARAFIEQMRPGDQAGMMVYNTQVNYVQQLTTDHAVLTQAIDNIQTGGDTAMYDALIAAEDALKDVSGRKAIIAVTDGLDNRSTHKEPDVVAGTRSNSLSISTIGLGDATSKAQTGLDEATLQSLAPVVQTLTAQIPAYRTVRIVTPVSYRWPTFLLADNLRNVANQITVIALIAIGMTFIIITGGFDLSVGSTFAFGGLVVGQLLLDGWPVPLAIAGAVAAGALVGMFNGLLITKVGVNPFVTTLGSMTIVRGIVLLATQGNSITGFPEGFVAIGQGKLAGVFYPVIIMAVFLVGADLLLRNARFLRKAYYVGGNEEAARLSGFKVDEVKNWLYVITGALSALAGVISTAKTASSSPIAGTGAELRIIAAVVVESCACACSVVAKVLSERRNAVWSVRGGTAVRSPKGLAGPDMAMTEDSLTSAAHRCKESDTVFVSGDEDVDRFVNALARVLARG